MVLSIRRLRLAALGLAAAVLPAVAHAQQKSEENAVTSSDDAFGTSVGLEATGIYSQFTVRGFNPTDAGHLEHERAMEEIRTSLNDPDRRCNFA